MNAAKFIVVNNYKPITVGTIRINCMRKSSGGSVFGNPFGMKNKSQAERDRVCNSFDRLLHTTLESKNSALYFGLKELYKLAKRLGAEHTIELACCCKPKRCHCDSIAALLNAKLGN